jgi:heme/copper-type cytochrome/quinol oxidase subunit 2
MLNAFPRHTPYLLPVMIGIILVLIIPVGSATEPAEQYIDLTASQFAFTPERIVVNQGDRVVITLHADDVTHGFYLDGYGIETRAVPGVAQQITFTADNTGKFKFRCSVSCGRLHPFMIGELVIRPNNPFWKSILITLIALAGLLIFLWHSSEKRII